MSISLILARQIHETLNTSQRQEEVIGSKGTIFVIGGEVYLCSFPSLEEFLHSILKLQVTGTNHAQVSLGITMFMCRKQSEKFKVVLERACSLQGCFWCFQLELTDPLSCNLTKYNLLDMEDQICFGGDMRPFYDRGGGRTESSEI